MFTIRHATHSDLAQLIELEKVWPEDARATEQVLEHRINTFSAGYFVVEDNTGIYASMIAHPYCYDPHDLSNFKNWNHVNTQCYLEHSVPDQSNALYIISATNKKTNIKGELARQCMMHVFNLASSISKTYVLAGIVLPGYARFLKKHGPITPESYVFKQRHGRFVDPMLEKLKRLGFEVPTKQHVIANYFPDKKSLNYSALVVKSL